MERIRENPPPKVEKTYDILGLTEVELALIVTLISGVAGPMNGAHNALWGGLKSHSKLTSRFAVEAHARMRLL